MDLRDYKGAVLVLGGCSNCESSAKMTLRKVGKLYPTDYGIKYVAEIKKDPVFKNNPELGQFTSAFIYNPSAGVYVNLKNINLTQEARENIKRLFDM